MLFLYIILIMNKLVCSANSFTIYCSLLCCLCVQLMLWRKRWIAGKVFLYKISKVLLIYLFVHYFILIKHVLRVQDSGWQDRRICLLLTYGPTTSHLTTVHCCCNEALCHLYTGASCTHYFDGARVGGGGGVVMWHTAATIALMFILFFPLYSKHSQTH